MTRLKRLAALMAITTLLVTGCSSQDPTPADQDQVQQEVSVDPKERLSGALEEIETANSLRQVMDFNIEIVLEESEGNSETGDFLAQMIAMMSPIRMKMDMVFENFDYEDPMANPELKFGSTIEFQVGENELKSDMYIMDQMVYISNGEGKYLATPYEEMSEDLDESQFDLNLFIVDEINETEFEVEETTLELPSGQTAVTKFSMAESLNTVMEILSEDSTMNQLFGEDSEQAMADIVVDNVLYNLYVSEDNHLAKVEIAFDLIPDGSEELTGIESIRYQIEILFDGINDSVVEFPELS